MLKDKFPVQCKLEVSRFQTLHINPYLLKTLFFKYTDADHFSECLFLLRVYIQIPAHLTHSHLQQSACSEPTQCHQECGKQSHKLSRIRDLEFWERNFSSRVLLHLRSYLLRIFFQSSSRSLAVFFQKSSSSAMVPWQQEHGYCRAQRRPQKPNHCAHFPITMNCHLTKIDKTRNSSKKWANIKATGFHCFFKYIWKEMVPMYITKG